MKLATLKDGTRDGQLAVVSADLSAAHFADAIAPTLQRALDDWAFIAPQLEELSRKLNQGRAANPFPFDPRRCMAPLPRACQWIEAPMYEGPHGAAAGQADQMQTDAAPAEALQTAARVPATCIGGGDDFLGAQDDARFESQDAGIDFGAGLAAIIDDVPAGVRPAAALQRVRLLALTNGWGLRELTADEPAQEFIALQRRPATAFAPVAITPDELGDAWRDGLVHHRLVVHWNGRKVGQADAGIGARFGFDELIAQTARTRNLRAGCIIGTGVVANRDAADGFLSIAQTRSTQVQQRGQPETGYMAFGDRVRIELVADDGRPLFGTIDQQVLPWTR